MYCINTLVPVNEDGGEHFLTQQDGCYQRRASKETRHQKAINDLHEMHEIHEMHEMHEMQPLFA
jgi:hypothetical protein